MRAGVGLLAYEPAEVTDKLAAWMLDPQNVSIREVLLLRDLLQPHGAELAAGLWKKAEDREATSEVRLRAFAALAAYDPESARWRTAGPDAAEQLLNVLKDGNHPIVLELWAGALRPVREHLQEALVGAFRVSKHADRRLLEDNVPPAHPARHTEILD